MYDTFIMVKHDVTVKGTSELSNRNKASTKIKYVENIIRIKLIIENNRARKLGVNGGFIRKSDMYGFNFN